MLRTWQAECAAQVIDKFTSNKRSHFFCQATPGAGKTVMAAEVAKRLFLEGMIDLVLCFSPSLSVAEGMKKTFSWKLECSFNGGLGSLGGSYTYQSIRFLDENFWNTVSKYRVLVVFDEIHHCSFDDEGRSNSWGLEIVSKIQGFARYTLALSGTPWRSDRLPIVMAEYSDPDGKVVCDYQYGLQQAVEDKVCRRPKIVLIDNEHLSVNAGRDNQHFASILDCLKQSDVSYYSVIHNEDAMNYILNSGCQKLAQIRQESPNAGGLVVAASIKHAKHIQKRLIEHFNQSACIVTYHHDNPLNEIESFRHSNVQWIVSVGMISEGTDIPRLQVCCHMSSVKTELYFRQVLGRILRVNDSPNQEAWLYTFAEESLIGFAERIEQDIPDSCMYIKQENNVPSAIDEKRLPPSTVSEGVQSDRPQPSLLSWGETSDVINSNNAGLTLAMDELRLGQFKQRVIAAFT
ncbi:DEAD/DEAH box helicase family protein [Vibrio tubiashii]|uniref:DEAD/DEAH box helicase n=1 Tax=Vibrio tubiashii TaxID=29498 RepID=UPI001EFD2630|nr:DEAD/DEAH box helicase family protein [Vibrio tubiashii]MCG9582059.1 DEAD/DEAH box helicase family protein [Vibrio tubiashii]MCG9615650.1 DEAD/DEAH box helicase family protein [Vibrio tubiashii]MCG9686762.1 DEAD/DEAH box helicase family protein [Vibrio tubiashii]